MTRTIAREIAKQFFEGRSIRFLAEKYGYTREEIERAIREEMREKVSR